MCSSKEFRKITDHEFIFGDNEHDAGFVYEIPECTEAEMHTINALDSFVEMVGYIKKNLSLRFCGCRNEVFAENLELSTFALTDEDMNVISALNQNLRSNVDNDPETFPW